MIRQAFNFFFQLAVGGELRIPRGKLFHSLNADELNAWSP